MVDNEDNPELEGILKKLEQMGYAAPRKKRVVVRQTLEFIPAQYERLQAAKKKSGKSWTEMATEAFDLWLDKIESDEDELTADSPTHSPQPRDSND